MTEASRWRDLTRPETLAPTATVALGVVLFAFNAFVVATALPKAVAEFGGRDWLAWATALYIIASMLSGPSAAWAMRGFGARRVFGVAGGIFLAGTILAAGAPGMGWLLAGRALQGFGAGLIESGCYVLIPQLFPPRLIPRVFGVEAVAWAVAAFGAPVLAGVLAEKASWRWALLTAVPMALAFLALVPRVVPEGRGEAGGPLAWKPLLGLTLGMSLVLLTDLYGLWALAAGIVVFALVLRGERRAAHRLFPRGAFGGGALGLGLWLAFLMPASQAVESVFLPYGLQMLWGWTPVLAGMAGTVLALTWSLGQAALAGVGGNRRRLIFWGAGLLALGQGAMVWAFAGGGTWAMLGAQALIGLGMGAAWGALSQMVMEEAGEEQDLASGLLPVVMSAGYGVGAALFGALANQMGFGAAEGEGLRAVLLGVFGLGLGIAVVGLIPGVGVIRGPRSGSSR